MEDLKSETRLKEYWKPEATWESSIRSTPEQSAISGFSRIYLIVDSSNLKDYRGLNQRFCPAALNPRPTKAVIICRGAQKGEGWLASSFADFSRLC